MKLSRLSALLACAAVMAPWGAQAAMEKTVQAHCDCSARVVNKEFSQQEIEALSSTDSAPAPALTQKLQKLVAENCTKSK
ncbi:hypothetical protein ALP12_01115 [Pseudomonas savastanoi pv. phaseolicola]|uniref:hypothetical protein n=1 Tax=Pseudomonas savastanoi TaxID=29438 RepID=UPI0006B8FEEC|nr:hypothetical protein [Pseudomonas savastanoi]KPB43517.1 Uncharacterized protein AC515_1030 [Pseudomonas savastanoi pv. phaseolicola]RMV34918.1 hypothetical protein ALP12_01115 [Pseudomonas savastanoi pv. phaseolicola]